MKLSDISVPEVYKSSSDFRTFLKWFETALDRVKYDTENLPDLYDPLRCKTSLLWLLGDTMGFKYDDRLCAAFNRLVMMYFMSMIRHKGSKDGVTLAAEVNLAQFSINKAASEGYLHDDGTRTEPNDILYERLEDTSIPVNSVYVTPHTDKGYIDVVYFSSEKPVDACIEYVRPIGMYVFQSAGVRFDSKTKVSVDARLTDERDRGLSIGPTHVGHYRREDYARMQKITTRSEPDHTRNLAWYRNSKYEDETLGTGEYESGAKVDAGYRTLYSLQLANNAHIVDALIGYPFVEGDEHPKKPVFGIGKTPLEVAVRKSDNYILPDVQSGERPWNLRYDPTHEAQGTDGRVVAGNVSGTQVQPITAVNPVMAKLGDGIALNSENTEYTKVETIDGKDTITKYSTED